MRNLSLISLFFSMVLSPAFGAMKSNMPSTFFETGIPNSHLLSENVIRGMAPRTQKDLKKLLEIGVDNFLIFKIDTNGDVAKEISRLLEMGVSQKSILQLNFPWKDITDYQPVCEMTIDALNMIKISEEQNQKIYFHCTVGEDRTGLLAGLYKIYRGDNESRHETFESELCDKGYEAGNPEKIYSVAKKVRDNLTPAFMGMADLIEKNRGKILNKEMCKSLVIPKVNFKVYSCKKSRLI